MGGLHPDSPPHTEITLGWGRGQGAVGGEDAVVHKPCGSVELGEEGLDAPAVAVLRVGDGLQDGGADNRLEKSQLVYGDNMILRKVTYNSGLLVDLTVAGSESLPSDRGVVAAVEDVECLEGNVGLLAVVCAELFTRGESNGVDNVGSLATTVADDVDSGAPVDKVNSESLFCELKSVTLDELLEDAGDLCGILVGQALIVTLALALALALDAVPGTSVTPAPRALGLPVTGSSSRCSDRSGCSEHGRNHGRGHCDDGGSAHVDGCNVG
jgi:hypothetical protein